MTIPTFSLHGKVGLVTGALVRGIGKAIALALAEAGADIVAVARTGSEIEATVAGGAGAWDAAPRPSKPTFRTRTK